MALSLGEINDRLTALEAFPDENGQPFCKRRLFQSYWGRNTYFLEITRDAGQQADNGIEAFQFDPKKTGILLIGGLVGNEPDPAEGLVCAAQLFAKTVQDLLAWRGHNAQFTINGSVFTLATVKAILDKLDIVIVPVVDKDGYPTARGSDGVDLSRNFPVLWNMEQYDVVNSKWNPYFFNNKNPVGTWNQPDPLIPAAVDSLTPQSETKALMTLMRKNVSAFVNFQTGYGGQIMYPWGFFSANQGNISWRYCNPYFTWLTPKPGETATPSYAEYMPQAAINNQTAAATAMQSALASAGADFCIHAANEIWKYDGNNPTTKARAWGTKAPDPAGGICIDYFIMLDLCRVISLHIESGDPGDPTGNITRNIQACFLSLTNFMLSFAPAEGARRPCPSKDANGDPWDWPDDIDQDWKRTPTTPGGTSGW